MQDEQSISDRALANAIRLLVALSLALLIPLAGVRVLKIGAQFSRPAELTYPDSVTVRIVRGMMHGEPLYRDFHVAPHVHATYGPLFYEVPALIARAVNADEIAIFEILRALSLASILGSVVVIGVILRRSGIRFDVIALVLGVYVLAVDATWPGMLLERPDPEELLFTLLGLACVAAGRRALLYTAPLLFVVAFLFKQSAIVGPAAAALYLYAYRGRRAALTFSSVCAIVFATAIESLDYATSGLYAMNDFAGLASCNLSWTNPFSVLGPVIAGNYAILLAACFGVLMAVLTWRLDLFVVFFVLHAAFAAGTTLRDGSAPNYYTTTIAAACVICGQVLGALLGDRAADATNDEPRWNSRSTAAVLLVAIVLFTAGRLAVELGQLSTLWQAFATREQRHAEELRHLRTLSGKLDSLGGPILSQDDSINLYARSPIMADLLAFGCFADRRYFDDAQIIDMIRNREFAAIVLRFPASQTEVAPRYQSSAVFRDEWLTALRHSKYRESFTGRLYVYTPDRAPNAPNLVP
jgi:hypothetical protein